MKVARLVIPDLTIFNIGTVRFAKFLAKFTILGTIRDFQSDLLHVVVSNEMFDEVEDNGIRWVDRTDLPKVHVYLSEEGKLLGATVAGVLAYHEDVR